MAQADFGNLLAVLRREAPARPTLFEFFLNERLYERLGGPVDPAEGSLAGQLRLVRAFAAAGYDYATIHGADFGFSAGEVHRAASISQNEGAVITDRASFEAYPWPDPDACDYRRLADLAPYLPVGLKLVVPGPGGTLENAIRLVGYEPLCLLTMDDPALADDVFAAIGSRLVRYYEHCAAYDTVGALIANDDWGHKTQTLLPPAAMRRYVFPWHARIVAAIHAAGKPAILHSCGARHEIMADIVALGFDGVHSYEDLIQPVEAAYEQWHEQVAILGGIDVDFLCRASLDQIRARSAAMLDRAAQRGSYALGSGNSIPYYVPDESYFAMVEVATAGRGS